MVWLPEAQAERDRHPSPSQHRDPLPEKLKGLHVLLGVRVATAVCENTCRRVAVNAVSPFSGCLPYSSQQRLLTPDSQPQVCETHQWYRRAGRGALSVCCPDPRVGDHWLGPLGPRSRLGLLGDAGGASDFVLSPGKARMVRDERAHLSSVRGKKSGSCICLPLLPLSLLPLSLFPPLLPHTHVKCYWGFTEGQAPSQPSRNS